MIRSMTTRSHRHPFLVRAGAALGISALFTLALAAEAPRALPSGQLPHDVRLEPPKDLDGYFPFQPPASREQWNARAQQVRRQLLVALGLWPMPTKAPLHPVIHGRIERPDYSVEKVCFESFPGFFVTGNLYRPKNQNGKVPGVLCPHGHWENGRFTDAGAEATRREIVNGAERFENGGRSPLQSRCVELARMGCVVFHYDMIGYADSQQISYDIAHRFAKQRPGMNTTENWGLFSPQAEAHLQSIMGLQAFNSICALDFLLSLPEIDADRIGVTGASGGGTQTFVLGGIDPRPSVIFPAVMVSTAMQGGCTCENASYLRIDTGNVEIAALFAPKPLGMTAANDWTKEMPAKGFPELQQHYKMMGAPGNVFLKPLVHFGHNYNYVSRAAMYSWFNKHFKLGLKEPIVEEDYPRLTAAEMTVWDEQHPKPESGPDFERKLLRAWAEDSAKKLAQAEESPSQFRELAGAALDVLIGRTAAHAGETEWALSDKKDRGDYLEMSGLIRNQTHHEELPAVFVFPKSWNGRTILWLDSAGKQSLYGADGQLKPEIQKLIKSGATVASVDLLFQGEFLSDPAQPVKNRRVKNPREAAAFTFGYNYPLFAQRVQDILTAIHFAKTYERKSEVIDLVGLNGAGPLVAAARAQAGDLVDRAAIDTGGFRFGNVLDLADASFLPGGAKYGDLPGMLALNAPGKLWLAGETGRGAELVKRFYSLANASDKLVLSDNPDHSAAAADWLLAQ